MAHLALLLKYHATRNVPLWVGLETIDSDPLQIDNFLSTIINPVTQHSLSLWDRVKRASGLLSLHNPLLSFMRNPAFYPAFVSPLAPI